MKSTSKQTWVAQAKQEIVCLVQAAVDKLPGYVGSGERDFSVDEASVRALLLRLRQDPPPSATELKGEEKHIVEQIRRETSELNRNNITRTSAYLQAYERSPELHWALLAHLVSRNGGWNMTDLKGELLPHILPVKKARSMFLFLERANALIFQDAYPQLLLYLESKRLGRPLFHLLPHFYVSRFMLPVWDLFWDRSDSRLLTVALIINEQNYIEGRLVQDPKQREEVLDSFYFEAQSLLQLNLVFFPQASMNAEKNNPLPLAGLILEHFSSLQERIGIGCSLYAMLYGLAPIYQGSLHFARQRPHSGSRADYWPELFSKIRHEAPDVEYEAKLDGCSLRPGSRPLYSPELIHAWTDVPIAPIERYDWYRDVHSVKSFLGKLTIPRDYRMSKDFCRALHALEWTVLAEEVFF